MQGPAGRQWEAVEIVRESHAVGADNSTSVLVFSEIADVVLRNISRDGNIGASTDGASAPPCATDCMIPMRTVWHRSLMSADLCCSLSS